MADSNVPITEIYDIGHIVSTELFREKLFSPLIDLTMANKRIHVHLKDDMLLNTIEIDLETRKISMKSPSVDLFDLISELYPTSRKEHIKKLLEEGKSWEYILRDFPKLHRNYIERSEKAKEVGEKYGIDFKLKVDQDGYEYLVLNLKLKNSSLKHIKGMLSFGLKIFKEYIYEIKATDQILIGHLDREFYKSELIQTLDLTKRIIREIFRIERVPSVIMISNYDQTLVRILIETKNELKDEISIIKEKHQYIIKMKKVSEDGHEIHSIIVNDKHDLIKWIENELKRVIY